jgi:polysaccharide biosynthesis protein PslH
MRILFVSRCLPLPRHLGDRLILFHLLAGLRSRGHKCEVVAFAHPDDGDAIRKESAMLADALEAVTERPRRELDYLAGWSASFPADAYHTRHPAMWEAVVSRVGAGGVDLVHFLGGIQVREHRDAARGRPRLIQPYESYTWWLTRAVEASRSPLARATLRLRRLAARHFERRIYLGFDRVVLNTSLDERALLALASELPTAVIPQGVDLPPVPIPLDQRPRSALVFVGNFAYRPNLDAARRLVAEILPRVRERVPDACLALVGADPPPALRRLHGDGVEVTGTVPDVLPWLGRARAFVSPITMGAGMKNKVLEAMAAGTPVVATPVSCDGIDLVDCEHALLASTPEALAQAAVRVLTDERLAGELARSARQLVEERYRWPSVIERYEALYAELIAAGPGRSRP